LMKAFTASELAALALPEMPADVSAMVKRAKREQWEGQRRSARGGGTEYPAQLLMKVLPEPAKEALLKCISAETAALPAVVEMAATPTASNQNKPTDPTLLADWQRNCANARAAIINELATIADLIGVDRAVRRMIQLADSREMRPELLALVPVANARAGKDGSRQLSYRTLYRWRTDYAGDGWNGLVPLDATRPKPVPAWAADLLKLYRVPTKRSLAAVLDELQRQLPAEVAPPSYDQARRFLASMSVVDRERGRHGPNGLLKFKAFKRRSTDGLEPLHVVTADGHTFKADVAHPIHGRPFRPELCSVMDVVTRYIPGWAAGLAESSTVFSDAVRDTLQNLGQFGLIYMDNGSGLNSSVMTDADMGMLARAGATITNSMPGRAQARGKIERLQHLFKSSARELPTYNGRDMDNEARRRVTKRVAADLRERGGSLLMMSWSDFLGWVQDKVDAYNNQPHRSLKKIRDPQTGTMRHMSPAEALAEFRANGWEPALLPASTIDDLARPYEIRTTVRGEVKLPWGRYFDQALVPFGGEKVRVGYEIKNGEYVWARTLEAGRLICKARRDANVIAEQPASKIEHALQRRAQSRVSLLDQHREEALAELGQSPIELQADRPMTPELAATMAVLEAQFEASLGYAATPAASQHDDESEDMKRFRRAIGIHRALNAGLTVPDADSGWFNGYRQSSEFRGMFALYETYGDEMFS
jgi:putative transposase